MITNVAERVKYKVKRSLAPTERACRCGAVLLANGLLSLLCLHCRHTWPPQRYYMNAYRPVR